MSDKLVIIDGNSIFYRSFYALPLLSNAQGEFSNAIYGFAMQVLNVISNIKPKYMVVAFDVSKHTFRNDIYDGYKATRKPMPDELRGQLKPLKEMLKCMNICIAEQEGLEGDDIIGIISKKFSDVETIIVTGDRDSFQLVDKTTKVYFTKKGTSDVKIMGVSELKSEYGVSPSEFIDVKALQGDTSDNIPGAKGIGPKTATDLIVKYGSIEKVYENIDEITGKTKEKLIESKDDVFMSKILATIKTDGDLDVSLESMEYDFPFNEKVYEFFKKYEFKTLLKNEASFNLKAEKIEVSDYKIEKVAEEKKLDALVAEILKAKKVAIYFDSEVYHLSVGEVEHTVNISFNLLGDGMTDEIFFEKLESVFSNEKVVKICFDSKKVMHKLKNFNIELKNYFDVSIAKYLVDGVPVDAVKDIFFDGKIDYIACNMIKFQDEYAEKIESEKLQFLFKNVEIPLSKVLFSMENHGFKVDLEILNNLKEKYEKEQSELENDIYNLSGERFNINSPKQLGSVLFEKLNLTHGKKQSTSADNLEEIVSEHPVVERILRYRKVTKFLSTYIDGMLPHIDKNGLIHTCFKQTLTTTGRLSSTSPNLQNIPIRSEESREIRSMFVASDEDHVLIDADYSQIELRLLAHCSEDESFVEAFKNGIDIHTKTASEVFGVPENLVNSEMRRTAKVVNFGIIYGISEYGLADDLKISAKEARAYISSFYEKHQAVQKFMEDAIAKARETGLAKTLFGRTRKMFDIKASNFMVRSRAERASQNMPLQGTAADIIKIAMVNTYNALQKAGLKAKLIMQVHDELIIDSPKQEKDEVQKILKEQMENAAKLIVPLEIDVRQSYRWSDGH